MVAGSLASSGRGLWDSLLWELLGQEAGNLGWKQRWSRSSSLILMVLCLHKASHVKSSQPLRTALVARVQVLKQNSARGHIWQSIDNGVLSTFFLRQGSVKQPSLTSDSQPVSLSLLRMCMHTCVCAYGGQGSLTGLDLTKQIRLAGYPVSPRGISGSAFPVLGWHACASVLSFLTWVLGTDLGCAIMFIRQALNWVISSAFTCILTHLRLMAGLL